jgi:hypothetical protein
VFEFGLFSLVMSQAPAAADLAKDPELLAKLALHAAAIAAFIRLAVKVLRSPLLAFVWVKIPKPVRPLVLVVLGLLAAVFDHLALGAPIGEAIFAAFGGVMGAVSSHEIQNRVKPPKAKPPAPAKPGELRVVLPKPPSGQG